MKKINIENYSDKSYYTESQYPLYPKTSFTIAGIGFYQNHLNGIHENSILTMELEPDNTYDKKAIRIMYNNNKIGYVPRDPYYQLLAKNNMNKKLKVICICKVPMKQLYGVRVMIDDTDFIMPPKKD